MTREEAEQKIVGLLEECSAVAEAHEIPFLAATTVSKDGKTYVDMLSVGPAHPETPKEIRWAYGMLGYDHEPGVGLVCESVYRMIDERCQLRPHEGEEKTTATDPLIAALDKLKEILGAAEVA